MIHSIQFGDPHLKPLILLHGFLGSHQDFLDIIPSLSHQYHVVCLDIESIEDDLYQCVSSYQDPIVVGYSMGGRLALNLAIHHPDCLDQLILISASPGIDSIPERELRLTRDNQWAEMLRTVPFSQFLDRWYDQPIFDSFRESPVFAHALSVRRVSDPERLALLFLAVSPGHIPSMWGALSQLKCPLTYVYGELDIAYGVISDRIRNECPHATIYSIPQSGHVVHLEAPTELVALLLDL